MAAERLGVTGGDIDSACDELDAKTAVLRLRGEKDPLWIQGIEVLEQMRIDHPPLYDLVKRFLEKNEGISLRYCVIGVLLAYKTTNVALRRQNKNVDLGNNVYDCVMADWKDHLEEDGVDLTWVMGKIREDSPDLADWATAQVRGTGGATPVERYRNKSAFIMGFSLVVTPFLQKLEAEELVKRFG